jgi:hypothetical protein
MTRNSNTLTNECRLRQLAPAAPTDVFNPCLLPRLSTALQEAGCAPNLFWNWWRPQRILLQPHSRGRCIWQKSAYNCALQTSLVNNYHTVSTSFIWQTFVLGVHRHEVSASWSQTCVTLTDRRRETVKWPTPCNVPTTWQVTTTDKQTNTPIVGSQFLPNCIRKCISNFYLFPFHCLGHAAQYVIYPSKDYHSIILLEMGKKSSQQYNRFT